LFTRYLSIFIKPGHHECEILHTVGGLTLAAQINVAAVALHSVGDLFIADIATVG
jgi:hypothetical protein